MPKPLIRHDINVKCFSGNSIKENCNIKIRDFEQMKGRNTCEENWEQLRDNLAGIAKETAATRMISGGKKATQPKVE